MDVIALCISILALIGTTVSLWLQSESNKREKKRFEKEQKIDLGFKISAGKYTEFQEFDHYSSDVYDVSFLDIDYVISNKGRALSIDKINMIFKDLTTGNFIGSKVHDFTNSVLFLNQGDSIKRTIRIDFNKPEDLKKLLNANVILKIEAETLEPIYSKTQKLVIIDDI